MCSESGRITKENGISLAFWSVIIRIAESSGFTVNIETYKGKDSVSLLGKNILKLSELAMAKDDIFTLFIKYENTTNEENYKEQIEVLKKIAKMF